MGGILYNNTDQINPASLRCSEMIMSVTDSKTKPDRFAGMCILSSWLREGTLGALGVADRVDSLPTLVHHGRRDELIDLERAKHSITLLNKLHVPVDYTEYDMGHEITSRSLADLSGWLEQKVLAGPIAL